MNWDDIYSCSFYSFKCAYNAFNIFMMSILCFPSKGAYPSTLIMRSDMLACLYSSTPFWQNHFFGTWKDYKNVWKSLGNLFLTWVWTLKWKDVYAHIINSWIFVFIPRCWVGDTRSKHQANVQIPERSLKYAVLSHIQRCRQLQVC